MYDTEENITTLPTKQRKNLYGFDYIVPDKRRLSDDKPRSHNIKQLWQRSHEIINLAARGYKNTDIAEIMNVTPACVSDTINSELGLRKLSEIRQDRDLEAKKDVEKIRVLTSKALETYHKIFDDESGECTLKDKKAVADTVALELSGLRAPTRLQTYSVHTELTADELASFKERGLKAAQDAGMIPV